MRKLNLPLLLWLVVAACFVGKEIAYILHEGHRPLGHADGMSEDLSRTGARNFVKHGFSYSAGLQIWPGFPIETEYESLKERAIYTHYFPGPDYVLTAVFAIFGESDESFRWARLIPMFLILSSLLLLTYAAEKTVFKNWKWGRFWFLLLVIFVPGLRWWAINLHGHAYSSACVFVGLSLGMLSTLPDFRQRSKQLLLLASAFAIGVVSNYALLTGAFIVCASPIVGQLLCDMRNSKKESFDFKNGLGLSFTVGLGLVAAWIIHLGQVAVVLGSWADAWHEQMSIASARAMVERSNNPTRLMLIGRYSDLASRFFFFKALTMLPLTYYLAWLHRPPRMRLCLASTVAILACYAWILLLKNHSIDHPHVNPRVFMLLYVCFAATLVSLAANHCLSRLAPNTTSKRVKPRRR